MTDDMVLRPMVLDDAAALHEVTGDARVMRHYVDRLDGQDGWTIEQTTGFAAGRGLGRWAIEVGGRLVGYCGLSVLTYLPVPDGTVEISYRLHPDVWGQGLAVKAAAAVVGYAFDVAGLPSVFASITTDNAASLSVARKLGMSLRGAYPYVSPVSGRSAVFLLHGVDRAHTELVRRTSDHVFVIADLALAKPL